MKLMAIDGNSLLNRAYYGVRLLSNKDGVFTNAVFGFLNMYLKLLDDFSPDHVCVCFDVRAKTFRHAQFEAYKAGRKPMPEELAMQMPLVKEALDLLGVPRLEKEGFEADDLLGTLAQKCRTTGDECIIVTGDRDSLQFAALDAKIALIISKMGNTTTKVYDIDAFSADYNGLTPDKLVDLKAIMGDSSDNIPGVPGIGEKGAMDLLCRFGSLSAVYENIDSDTITASMRKKLVAGRDSAFMSYELARGITDVDIDEAPENFILKSPNQAALLDFLNRLELKSLIKRLNLSGTVGVSVSSATFSPPKMQIVPRLPGLAETAIYPDFSMGQMGVCSENACYVCPITSENLEKVMSSSYVVHNGKAFLKAVKSIVSSPKTPDFDTSLAAYLLNPTESEYSLDTCALAVFSYNLPPLPESQLTLTGDSDEESQSALALRAALIFALKAHYLPLLQQEGMLNLLQTIELPLLPVLADMEIAGIKLDIARLVAFGTQLDQDISALVTQIIALAGQDFNISSPKQLSSILFETLKLKPLKKTKSGFSTDNDVLEKLSSSHEIIDKIISYRRLTKLKSTYVDGLIKVVASDGRIHTTFNQTVTATGRLSSTDPNLQNIPIRRDMGTEIRRCFVPQEGCIFIDADYSQIELRLLAHIAQDSAMISAFNNNEDIHTVTASQVFHVPLDQVTSQQRSRAKAVNFGIVYGISGFSLSDDIKVSIGEAQHYIDAYFEKYPGVRDYMNTVRQNAEQDGYVTTMYGRRRNLPELKSTNHNIRSFGMRAALNTPIQGAAADIIKLAMIKVHAGLIAKGLRARLLLQVHDELIIECPLAEKESVSALLKQEMESAASLSVTLTADTSFGDTWYDAK